MALGGIQNERDLLQFLKREFPILDVPNVQARIALLYEGNGSPENAVAGPTGALYLDKDGGASLTLYIKESSPTPTTGWVAK